MPKKFVFSVNDHQRFEGKLHTGRCSGTTKTGERCKRNCIIGFEYCYLHLEKEQQLRIKDSTIPQADKGLFAMNKNKDDDEIIFRAGDTITRYNGQVITQQQRRQRYGNKTAPYAVNVGNKVIDAALKRGVGSLANTRPSKNNATLSVYTRNNQPFASIKATKTIRNGDEIFNSYGGMQYKLNERGVYFATKNSR